jgi:hypothetical protein
MITATAVMAAVNRVGEQVAYRDDEQTNRPREATPYWMSRSAAATIHSSNEQHW